VPYKNRVPRHLISTFTGDVAVTATLSVNDADKQKIAKSLQSKLDLDIDILNFPSELVFQRQQRFKDGDFVNSFFTLRTEFKVKGKKQRKWRSPIGNEMLNIRNVIHLLTPDIAYFPTFVFDFPETTFLTERGSVVDRFYRRVFQDILDFDGRGHTIEKDIVRRVRGKDMVVPWLSFLNTWGQHDERAKIQHVMDRASFAVTRLVFGRWNKIFAEDTRGK